MPRIRYTRANDRSAWQWSDASTPAQLHGPFATRRAAKRDRALHRIRELGKPVRVACPDCGAPWVREAQSTLESQRITAWELGADGRPQPSEYADTVTHYETAESYGYDCATCGSEFAHPVLVGVDRVHDVRRLNRQAQAQRAREAADKALSAEILPVLRHLIASVEGHFATPEAAAVIHPVLVDARRIAAGGPA